MRRSVSRHLTAEMLHAYSRRGNFHSEPGEARRLGLPGLVAQGMQVAAPAYGLLLDAWGDPFLATGELDLKFVGMVTDGHTVDATVEVEGDTATLDVTCEGAAVAVGTARNRHV